MPSSSYWGQPFAKKAVERMTTPKVLRGEALVNLASKAVADAQLEGGRTTP